ncbi:MAG: diacylglycerol kinase family protein [Clostridia bacterium]|nr:diacylglycerol kinase family protein [Clostridia bacterium]
MKKLINSFKYAICGILTAFKEEKNMKVHVAIMVIVIVVGILLKINAQEWIICVILFGLVIASELINTAIEITVDLAMPKKNENAKKAKDISAGAVLINTIVSIVIGLIIFVPKIFLLFNK